MNIDNVMKFFYKKISIRVKHAVDKSGLRQEDIHSNQKLISKIINNKRDRHNRFLIIDSVFECSLINDETGERHPGGLLGKKELGFKDIKEVLWGTDEEINNYLFDLFELLILEVFSDPNEYNLDIEKYLCDYIPYAKNSTYLNVINKNTFPALFYGVSEDEILSNLFPAREEAIRLIYNRCSTLFKKDFFSFIKEVDSFRGIDKTFKSSFIDEKFVPLIRNTPPKPLSLGLRIQQLVLEDLSHTASLIVGETVNNIEYKRALIHASSEYVLALEEIHKNFLQKKRKWN